VHLPAPSTRTSSRLRFADGSWAIAAVSTCTWSATVFEPALPGRNVIASSSVVLSHHTPIGWNPNVFFRVPVAPSFSECACTRVASTSSTTRSGSKLNPATDVAGGRPSGSSPHT